MIYVALLRGINVGGNNLIKMSDLKIAFEKNGFKNVITYINSGNVIFESNENNIEAITNILESKLSITFNYDAKLVIRSYEELKDIISKMPGAWKKENDLRCYIAFIKSPATPDQIIKIIELKEGVDSIMKGKSVIYMSTKLDGLMKSGFKKLISKKVYQDITMRNLNTTQKILEIMEKN